MGAVQERHDEGDAAARCLGRPEEAQARCRQHQTQTHGAERHGVGVVRARASPREVLEDEPLLQSVYAVHRRRYAERYDTLTVATRSEKVFGVLMIGFGTLYVDE